jgi:hypothetical protein
LRQPEREEGAGGDPVPADWRADFEAAARRPLPQRFRYSFLHTYKPVLDDAPFRAFESLEAYRRWCAENLPSWLGYGRVWVPPGGGGPTASPATCHIDDIIASKPAAGRVKDRESRPRLEAFAEYWKKTRR